VKACKSRLIARLCNGFRSGTSLLSATLVRRDGLITFPSIPALSPLLRQKCHSAGLPELRLDAAIGHHWRPRGDGARIAEEVASQLRISRGAGIALQIEERAEHAVILVEDLDPRRDVVARMEINGPIAVKRFVQIGIVLEDGSGSFGMPAAKLSVGNMLECSTRPR